MDKLTPADITRLEIEIRRRRLKEKLDFTSWLKHTQPLLDWDARHLVYIREHLDALVRGDLQKLMVFAPPRHGKSQQNSISFPAWYLECNPEHRVIIGAYNSELSESFSRQCRRLTRAPLSEDRKAVNNWDTQKGGGLRAVGVGGGVTGHGGSLVIIDDPVRSRADADSELFRDRCWGWYRDDLYTRLEPGGKMIFTMTRWHDADLAGMILNSDDAKNWTVITLPAFADADDPLGREPGEPLWPGRYDAEALEGIRNIIGPQSFNSLYMQNPIPDSGDYFQRNSCQWYDKAPENIHIYGASDYAVTEGGGDFTEHGVFGLDEHDNIYVLDWWSGQTQADVWIDKQLDLVKKWGPLQWIGESGPIRRSIEPFLLKRSRERKVYCRFEWLSSINDKPTRARAFQARWAMGKVFLPTNTLWADRLLAQMVRFPAGKNDDAVDVCSLIGRGLDNIHGAGGLEFGGSLTRDRWDMKFSDSYGEEESWKVV
jgi:predicted phage terminase large subunit-like protein